MYLRGSKWSMSKRRKPLNLFRIMFLAVVVGAAIYVNQFIVPTIQPIGVPTLTPTRDPESYLTDAESLYQQGKFGPAIAAFAQVVQARPKDAATYIEMARAQVWYGKYEDAQKSAEYALLLNPNNSMAYAVRGWALDFQGKYLDSETSIKRALAIDGNNALAHAYYAELLADIIAANPGGRGDAVTLAGVESKTALGLDAGLFEAHRARGYVYYVTSTDNLDLAVGEYQAAIAINKNIEDVYIKLGLAYQAMALNNEAIDAFGTAISDNPTDPLPSFYTSRIYATLGQFDTAIQYAQTAVGVAPADTRLHGNLGVMFYRKNRYPEAIQELSYVIKGGTLADGTVVKPLDITDSSRTPEYFSVYGLALAKLKPPRCGEAVLVAQQIRARLPGDETSVFNADEINRLCSLSADATAGTPVISVTNTPAAPVGAGGSATITPTP